MLKAASDPTIGPSPNMENAASDPTTTENEPTVAASDPTTTGHDPTVAASDPTTTSCDPTAVSSPKDSSNMSEADSGAMKILRCIVDNQKYPITLKTFHKLFSRFGKVKKIVLFTKNGQLQALIEFQNSATAQKALITLDNKNIYDGCCYMRIDYSNIVETLKVLYNNDKTWDFTRPDLPSSGPGETAEERIEDSPQHSQTSVRGMNNRGGVYRGKGDMGRLQQDSPQHSQTNIRGMNNRGGVYGGKGDMGYGVGKLQDIPQHSQPNLSGGNYRGGGSRGNGDMGYGMGNVRGHQQYSGRGMDRSMGTMGRNRGHVGRRNHPYEREDTRQRGTADVEYEEGHNSGPMVNPGRAMHRPRGNMGEAPRGMRGMGRPMTHMDHGLPGRGSWRGNMRGHYMGGMDSAGSGPWN